MPKIIFHPLEIVLDVQAGENLLRAAMGALFLSHAEKKKSRGLWPIIRFYGIP